MFEKPTMPGNLVDWISAIGTVAIPVVLFFAARRYNRQKEISEIENRTLLKLSELNQLVADAVRKKDSLDNQNGADGKKRFSHDYISENGEVEHCVFSILNEYNAICLGCNEGLYSDDIFLKLRGSAFKATLDQYGEYIDTYRNFHPQHDEAWKECDRFLARVGN